jgi:hypothetical protein
MVGVITREAFSTFTNPTGWSEVKVEWGLAPLDHRFHYVHELELAENS